MNLELLKNHPYISPDIKIERFNSPYNYIVIDNLFKEEIYNSMCELFPKYINRQQKPAGKIGDSERFYNALIYSMKEEDCKGGYDFFTSEIWKDFIAETFGLILNQHTAYSLHFHNGSPETPSKSGWPHGDIAICSVIDDPSKKIKIAAHDCIYDEDTEDLQPHTNKVVRQVALLYYFNNKKDLQEGDGGGTGVYTSYDEKSLVKEVKPINNRIFAFEVCPHSYHGFIGAKFDRSSIVQWFHSSPSYFLYRNLAGMKNRVKNNLEFFERWKKGMLWNIEKDPYYFKYFNSSLKELLR